MCEGPTEGGQTVGRNPQVRYWGIWGPMGFSSFWPTAMSRPPLPPSMSRGGGSRGGSWETKFPILGYRVCGGPTEGGQTVEEKPPGQILGNLGADRIFEFLANCHLETPPLGIDVETPPLSTWQLGGKKGFPHTGNSRADRMMGWNLSREQSGGYFNPIPYCRTCSQPFWP